MKLYPIKKRYMQLLLIFFQNHFIILSKNMVPSFPCLLAKYVGCENKSNTSSLLQISEIFPSNKTGFGNWK